ncbi:MAG: HlyD family efflux transporter periplasmic adaptor subunit [Gemmatimonadaceae bacterium]|nr:HlyD family efflux transporter periplasmic adaptor subunit [Gloeobacterales cyanobacterium ES-bin-141]
MDSPHKSSDRRTRFLLFGIFAMVAIAFVAVSVLSLKPALPSVERSTIWVDTVRRGPMLRAVRGLGKLVPEQIRWVPALSSGRVERILARPGAAVRPDTVLLVLSNPELQQSAVDAQLQLKAAEAEAVNLKVELTSQQLNQRAQAAIVQSDYKQAMLQAAVNEELATQGLISQLTVRLSRVKVEELATRNTLELQRIKISQEAIRSRLAVQQTKIAQLRNLTALKQSQIEALRVRAGIDGVLQQLPVEVGQQVTPGTNLARVADPRRLKAELKIAETQAKDVQLGQVALIDTRNGTVSGRVKRIDPAVLNGTVTVDVSMDGNLPGGARPDLSVEGTIELERLRDVLYVGRPAFGQAMSTVELFKLEKDGENAVRVPVKLGRSSVTTIEILKGLEAGEQVILSDMPTQEASERIHLE